VNPLIPAPYRYLARAAEESGEHGDAVSAYRALLLLDETDSSGVHYRLARVLAQTGRPQEARREVLRCLEEAPRYRDAHRLLLELVEQNQPAPPARPGSTPF
jgi:tetratricopeptide (TPR) repeat protein